VCYFNVRLLYVLCKHSQCCYIFFVQMSSSETESDSENDNESESELESYTLQILKEHVQF
jgi:hypothetical protein